MAASVLRALWKKEFTAAGELDPLRLTPTVSADSAARRPKIKPSSEHAAVAKRARASAAAARKALDVERDLQAAAAERQRTLERAARGQQTFECKYSVVGCTHRHYLSPANAKWHEQHACPFRPETDGPSAPDARAATREAMLGPQRSYAESNVESASVKVDIRRGPSPSGTATVLKHAGQAGMCANDGAVLHALRKLPLV